MLTPIFLKIHSKAKQFPANLRLHKIPKLRIKYRNSAETVCFHKISVPEDQVEFQYFTQCSKKRLFSKILWNVHGNICGEPGFFRKSLRLQVCSFFKLFKLLNYLKFILKNGGDGGIKAVADYGLLVFTPSLLLPELVVYAVFWIIQRLFKSGRLRD